jgi:hypothetical protein
MISKNDLKEFTYKRKILTVGSLLRHRSDWPRRTRIYRSSDHLQRLHQTTSVQVKNYDESSLLCLGKYSGCRLMGSLWDREKLIPITD